MCKAGQPWELLLQAAAGSAWLVLLGGARGRAQGERAAARALSRPQAR